MIRSPKKHMAEVISFYPHERPDLIAQLNNLNFDNNDDLRTNYQNLEWNWSQFQVISAYVNNHFVDGFSVAWHRPEYYKPGEIRILSRYWKGNSIRLDHTTTQLAMPHLVDMIDHQLQMCKELGYTEAFISRERSPRYFRKLITSIEQKTNTQWNLYKDKQCVCKTDDPSCWQYKASIQL